MKLQQETWRVCQHNIITVRYYLIGIIQDRTKKQISLQHQEKNLEQDR